MNQQQGSQSRRPTAADVARSLGLSRATVGFVLNETPGQTIPESTRQRVLTEAKRLGYRPHSAARALASGRSRIVLLILPDWPLDYSMRTNLDEASSALDRAGYTLVTMTRHPGGKAQPLWETLTPDAVMGMMPLPANEIAEIRASGVAHILTPGQPAGPLPGETDLGFAEGPSLQVEHLFERGRRVLAFAASPDPRLAELSAERLRRARATAGDLPGVTWVADRSVNDENAATTIFEWLSVGVDGVVAYNDDVAALVVRTAVRAGVPVPERLAVIGHDDTPLARLFLPALTTVRVDTIGLGRYLAELALSAVIGGAPPAVGPELQTRLVMRETT